MIHIASLHTLIVGFRNEALNSFLAEEKIKQEELTHQLQKAHDKLYKISLTDELTGLWNRRYLNATIQKDIAPVLRKYHNINQGLKSRNLINTDIVFIMVDLDHFKIVNDSHGHGAGDQVLVQMSHLLKECSRDMDTTIRWGGEEFLVISRNTRRENYTILVERIRQAVQDFPFDINLGSPIHLTCSMGAAVFPFLTDCPEVLSWEAIIELADVCLYAAKRSGRNTWVGVIPADHAGEEDFEPGFQKQIPRLVQEGKLDLMTSLKEDVAVHWSD